jgi:hypothetical protein
MVIRSVQQPAVFGSASVGKRLNKKMRRCGA